MIESVTAAVLWIKAEFDNYFFFIMNNLPLQIYYCAVLTGFIIGLRKYLHL